MTPAFTSSFNAADICHTHTQKDTMHPAFSAPSLFVLLHRISRHGSFSFQYLLVQALFSCPFPSCFFCDFSVCCCPFSFLFGRVYFPFPQILQRWYGFPSRRVLLSLFAGLAPCLDFPSLVQRVAQKQLRHIVQPFVCLQHPTVALPDCICSD